MPRRDLCESPFSVILNEAKLRFESRICWYLRDSSVTPFPQNDKLYHFRIDMQQNKVNNPSKLNHLRGIGHGSTESGD